MKIFSKEMWGTVLIGLGGLIFFLVIYDTIRPYFPRQSPYTLVKRIQNEFEKVKSTLIKPRDATGRKMPPPARKPPQRPPSAKGRSGFDRWLTSDILRTEGRQNLWVWKIKPKYKTGEKVKLEIAHAAGGKKGGFWMVAYADTDGDKKPDREIAKSRYFEAEEAGDWSVWEFETGEENVFVGNTWPEESDTAVYRSNGEWPPGQTLLEGRFYYKIVPGCPECSRSAGPAFTNMRVSFPD